MTQTTGRGRTKVGVSEATVSRVLNGKPGVSEATRQAVLTALDVLGYERPTKLRGERARLVGLVLPELQNPIFPAFAEVVGGALAQQGFTPVLCTQTAGGVTEADYVELLLQQQVSGVVFAGGLYAQEDAPHDHYARLAERKLPTVLVNASIEASASRGCRATTRSPSSRRWATCSRSATRGSAWSSARRTTCRRSRKLAAARAVAARAGIAARRRPRRPLALLARGGPGRGHPAARARVTGIICASDPMALGAIRAARRAGLTVPGDVSVVGFDDSALMNCTDPPLTTVRQPIESMGRMVIELLVGQIAGARVPHDELLLRARAGRPRLDRSRRRLAACGALRSAPLRRLSMPFANRLSSSCIDLFESATLPRRTRRRAAASRGSHPPTEGNVR